jgi:hypothetical protein
MTKFNRGLLVAVLAAAHVSTLGLHADEGMWLFNAPPVQLLKERYRFEATPDWLEHVQKSSVRFNSGGSGSFVSGNGLVITNHHVAADALQKLSDAKSNYMRDGFHAKSAAEEIKCVDLELNVLMSIEDVTAQINAAVKPGATAAEAFVARRAAKAAIEKESMDKTGLRSDVVTLYQGARYHLYRFKRYTDVRLVFAPEQQAAFFGGDPDNFEFPRYDLDIALFRVYENGQPAKTEHHLAWNTTGLNDGDLVFVSGHPGGTERLLTVAELEYQRDVRVPRAMAYLKSREVLLSSYSARDEENARRAKDELFGIQNSRKVYDGRAAGLLDPALFAAKNAEEATLKTYAAEKPELGAKDAWDAIATAQGVVRNHANRFNFIEAYDFNSQLFAIARRLYRAPTEFAKPSGERLREYRDSGKPELELDLFSEEPIYDDLEILKLTHFLIYLAKELGVNDPVVKAALGGKAPAERATELVLGTKVKEVAVRKSLYGKSAAEVEKSADPMIALARAVDSEARAVRKIVEEQGEAKEQAHQRIAKVRFAKFGANQPPDATFTLRLSFGTVKGYEELGKPVPPFTKLGGLYERSAQHSGREPFDLSPRWAESKSKLDLATPFNFVSTCDIIGGNSGSPVINRGAEFVGIIFDGNLQSLVLDYSYTEKQARALSVDARAIIEALRKVYGADALVNELLGK